MTISTSKVTSGVKWSWWRGPSINTIHWMLGHTEIGTGQYPMKVFSVPNAEPLNLQWSPCCWQKVCPSSCPSELPTLFIESIPIFSVSSLIMGNTLVAHFPGYKHLWFSQLPSSHETHMDPIYWEKACFPPVFKLHTRCTSENLLHEILLLKSVF